MEFSLIICTYKRPRSLKKTLDSVREQTLTPQEVIIVDGSPDQQTEQALNSEEFPNLRYFQVGAEHRGLTRQRNYGIGKAGDRSEILCFLDDDVMLKPDYFEKLLEAYKVFPEAVGVGGYICESGWKPGREISYDEFGMDGFKRKLGRRNVLRKKLGILSDSPPGIMPEFSNGFSTGFLPPTGKIYPVEFFMGGVASFRRELFEKIRFSPYFEGYGLYEDMDFCLRASKLGSLYVNTAAQLFHYHEQSGRPNQFQYGKMVLRNGWYVWRVKYPFPKMKDRLKWHTTAFLLTFVRFGNVITTRKNKQAFTEALGRVAGWWSLIFNKPRHEL